MLGMRSKYTVNAFPPFLAIQPSFFLPPPRFLFPVSMLILDLLSFAQTRIHFSPLSLPSPSFYVSFSLPLSFSLSPLASVEFESRVESGGHAHAGNAMSK